MFLLANSQLRTMIVRVVWSWLYISSLLV